MNLGVLQTCVRAWRTQVLAYSILLHGYARGYILNTWIPTYLGSGDLGVLRASHIALRTHCLPFLPDLVEICIKIQVCKACDTQY